MTRSTTYAHMGKPSSTPFTNWIGHLGIFVSASVAKKEHDEFASNIDLIDVLPTGLYEAVMIPKAEVVLLPLLSSVATTSYASRLAPSTIFEHLAAIAKKTSASSLPSPACRKST